MTTKHTPGPWNVCATYFRGAVTHWHITGDKHGSVYPVCNHAIEVEPEPSEQLANALLIASAPELLEALTTLVGRIAFYSAIPEDQRPCIEQWEYTDGSGDMQKARAAIAKATGELT